MSSGIFGIVRRDGAPVPASDVAVMKAAMADWGRDGVGLWSEGNASLGQARTHSTPEGHLEALPRFDPDARIAFTAQARLDNRDGLITELGLRTGTADGDIVQAAYRRWGEQAPSHIYGDWAFAAWNARDRRLFVARDHYGQTSLYYYADDRVCAFASSRHAILALGLVPSGMDELYLAQVLTSWNAANGARTIHSSLKRLPPAHHLTVDDRRVATRCYWRMEEVDELRLPSRDDYVAAFLAVFDEAVKVRLRAVGPVAVSLSAGLDSGSVAATAARLRDPEQELFALTSVPLWDTTAFVGDWLGDEFPLASATAEFAGIEVVPIRSASLTPLAAIRFALRTHGEPGHAASNQYWTQEVRREARAHGATTLLTGATGNAGISWVGWPTSQSLQYQLSRLGMPALVKAYGRRAMPRSLLAWRARRAAGPNWHRASAINPAFAHQLALLRRRTSDLREWPRRPVDGRLQLLQPRAATAGGLAAESGAAFGLDVRDPTADARLMQFTLSVPDWVFTEPGTRVNRWLAREAMRGRLPDEVRMNRRRGQQAGDLVPRLRAEADEIDGALARVRSSGASDYVDGRHMTDVWRQVQREDSAEAFVRATVVLTRGLMAGLWLSNSV